MEIVILLVLVVAVGAVVLTSKSAWSNSKYRDALREEENFAQRISAEFPNAAIHIFAQEQSICVVDFASSKIMIGLGKRRGDLEEPYRADYDFSEIAAVDVKNEGNVIASTNRGSQMFGAALGGLAFGGIGAIILGLSGATVHRKMVRHLSLSVRVLDQERPIHEITFFKCEDHLNGAPAHLEMVKQSVARLETFAAHIENAIHRSKTASPEEIPPADISGANGVASQLSELLRLKESGALTDTEFEAAKTQVIFQR